MRIGKRGCCLGCPRLGRTWYQALYCGHTTRVRLGRQEAMPIYEYVCRDCRLEFEALLRIDQRPSCQSCGSEQLERLLSVPAAPQRGPAKGSGQGGSAKSSSGGEGPRPCGMGGCGLPECE